MTKEKIWKIARGLRKFTLDELLILAEVDESKALKILENLIKSGKVKNIAEDSYIITETLKRSDQSKEQQKETTQKRTFQQMSKIPFNPQLDKELFDPEKEARDAEIFFNTPPYARKQAEKYLRVIQESKGLRGDKLKFFIQKWNEKYPEMKTSYSSLLKAKKILKEEGKLALLARYNPSCRGKTCVIDSLYIKFRDLYLSSKAPTMAHCYKTLKKEFDEEYQGKELFPSTSSFLRRLKRDFTQAEINYYRSQAKIDFRIPLYFKTPQILIPRNNKYSFISAADHFLKDYAKVKCSPSTVASYESYLKNHLLPYFGDVRLKNINEKRINDFVNLKISEGLSKTSINHMLKLLGLILDATLEMDYIDKNPVKQIKQMRNNGKKPKYLKEEDVKKLLSIAKENYSDFYPLLYTAITTGMRKGELLGLTWQHVNLKTRKITIKKSLYRNQLIDIRATKQSRVITITKELVDILKEWKLLCPKSNQDIVFPNSTGGFMDPDNMIKRRFNPLVEQAGIQNIQFQDLRNTYAYIMLSNNATLEYVQTQMGHYSVDVTFNRYGHFIPEKKEDYESVFKDLARGL